MKLALALTLFLPLLTCGAEAPPLPPTDAPETEASAALPARAGHPRG